MTLFTKNPLVLFQEVFIVETFYTGNINLPNQKTFRKKRVNL